LYSFLNSAIQDTRKTDKHLIVIMKKILRKYFNNLYYFYRHLRYRVFVSLLLSVLVGVLDGFGLAMFLPLLQMVNGGANASTNSLGKLQFLVHGIEGVGLSITLVTVLVLMFIFFVLKGAIKYLTLIYRVIIQQYFIRRLRLLMLNSFNNIHYRYYVESDIGKIQNVMSGEVDRVSRAYTMYFATFEQSILVAVYIGFAFYMDTKFALLVTFGGMLTNLLYKFVYKKTIIASREIARNSNAYQGQIIQHVSNFKYLKATGLLEKYSVKLTHTIHYIEGVRRKIGYYSSILGSVREPMLIGIVAIVIYLKVEVLGGSLGPIIISLLFFYRALTALTNMQNNWNRFLEQSGSLENLQDFQKGLNKAKETSGELKFDGLKDGMELKNVSVSYGEREVLRNISVKIKKNEIIAFVGESGSGKTTLLNVFIGLLKVDKGSLLIDGIESEKLEISSFQQRIGYVSQEPVIFNDTLFNNITFWAEQNEENLKRFNETIKKTSLSKFVNDLPKGHNSLLGSNGINLSGGQRQRVSIARELYKDIDILIMDEATSALDSETERAIQESIDSFKGKYTILVVAHRLSTVKNADRIALMRDGEILDINSFSGLRSSNSIFKSMVELQEIST
jgi:ABC-type multidrug transport system fused ATPase/permease subunit